jgi:methionine synthase II (cobalamin-independent)
MNKISWTTTVVGSFPKENTPENMTAAFMDQINAGIQYPCYPQLVSMISQFLDPLSQLNSGIVKKNGHYYLEGELKIPKEPFTLEYGKFVTDFFKKNSDLKKKVKGWKACLTGPFTLAGEIIVSSEAIGGKTPIVYQEPRAIMNPDLVTKIADMMAGIAKAYNAMGADIISMDEPTLALIVGQRKIFFYKEDELISILNRAIAPIERYSSVHVCGPVAPKLKDILLKSNVRILDHEFANGSNAGIFTKENFDRDDKTLAYGVVQTNVKNNNSMNPKDYIETEAVVQQRIQTAIDTVGKDNLIFKPDCGFAGLMATFGTQIASDIVRGKLKVLCDVMKKFDKK